MREYSIEQVIVHFLIVCYHRVIFGFIGGSTRLKLVSVWKRSFCVKNGSEMRVESLLFMRDVYILFVKLSLVMYFMRDRYILFC